MSDPIVAPRELAMVLGLEDPVDEPTVARMMFLIEMAQELCETVVSPCPGAAKSVVIGIAVRAWSNPSNVVQESIGPYGVSYGSSAAGGIYLSKQDRATLRRIAGRGGAFTIDPTPADAGQGLPPWDRNISWPFGEFSESWTAP